MNKEVRFTGYTAVPSDYDCPDGQLAQSFNLLNESGSMQPLFPPKVVLALDAGSEIVFIHKTSAFQHYIILTQSSKTFSWIDKDSAASSNAQSMLRSFPNVDVYGVDGVGNTLIILTSEGMQYFLWQAESSSYLFLGSHLPECPISFGLQGEMIRGEEFEISFDNINFNSGDIWSEFTDDNKTRITSQVLGKVNKFIAENSINEGRFMYPFFVRYAYRLYDGSLTMHSAPILMVCSSDLAPQCFCTNLHGYKSSTDINSAKLILAAMFHKLDYAVHGASAISSLKNWNDIIKSVDIFVSKPIYTYDQNGECTRFQNTDFSDSYSVCKHINQALDAERYPLRYQKSSLEWLYAKTFNPESLTAIGWRLMLPQRDAEAIKGDVAGNTLFYFLKSINVEDLKTDRTVIAIDKEYLQSLVTREVMTDDYNSHDTLIPRYSFGYNARLNVANLKQRLFNGFNASSLFQYTDGYIGNFSDADLSALDYAVSVSVYIHIKQDGKDIVVQGEAGSFGQSTPYLWIFYPNVNAYKAVVRITYYASFNDMYEVHLEPHPTLNGAFYFGDWEGLNATGKPKISALPSLSTVAQRTVDLPNKIYTSEVNNPFYFPLLGINTVGTGHIIGISSAAKALSQGQFGQFPLYAFSDDGVWALEVSSSGGYSAKQPITRDVCRSADSITQIDSAVLFATDRGIMLISGSQTQCISVVLNSPDFLDFGTLPRLCDKFPHFAYPDCLFTDYIENCRMTYDYINQRIILFNPEKGYAYVYSMKTKLWGIQECNLTSVVNSYPDSLAMAKGEVDGEEKKLLVDLSHSDDSEVSCLIVSRPIKFDSPDVLKTATTSILRGILPRFVDKVSLILYGTRDYVNWHLIASSQGKAMRTYFGTPYKAFRLVAVATLAKGGTIAGCSFDVLPRLTNRLR